MDTKFNVLIGTPVKLRVKGRDGNSYRGTIFNITESPNLKDVYYIEGVLGLKDFYLDSNEIETLLKEGMVDTKDVKVELERDKIKGTSEKVNIDVYKPHLNERGGKYNRGGITIDSREEYEGVRYEIHHKAPEGYYVVSSDWESTIIFTNDRSYFDTSDEAKEHAELEIWGYRRKESEVEEEQVRSRFKEGGRTQILKTCPASMEKQAIILDKEHFPSQRSVKTWAWRHKFKSHKIESSKNSFILEQEDSSKYRKDSFRAIDLAKGVKAIIACRKTNLKSKVKK